jgi:hypothetical protein
MRSLELTNTGVKFVPTEVDLEGALISLIQDYRLTSFYLKYERKDNPKNGTACFSFWLSGVDLNKEEYILLHLQELLQGFPALVKQLQEIAAGAGVNFYNSFNEDGYTIHCQAIHRRINRK